MFGQVFLLSYTKYSLLYNLSHQFIAVKPRLIMLRSSPYGTQTNQPWVKIISVVIYIYYVYPCVTLQFWPKYKNAEDIPILFQTF